MCVLANSNDRRRASECAAGLEPPQQTTALHLRVRAQRRSRGRTRQSREQTIQHDVQGMSYRTRSRESLRGQPMVLGGLMDTSME